MVLGGECGRGTSVLLRSSTLVILWMRKRLYKAAMFKMIKIENTWSKEASRWTLQPLALSRSVLRTYQRAMA